MSALHAHGGDTEVQRQEASGKGVAWKTLRRWMGHLEQRGELLRMKRPVDVVYEAGAIADLLVKNDGPAVLFEQPRLADGSIASMPLLMNAFGSHDRTLRALGATHETEIGDRMVAMMKPDIGLYMRSRGRDCRCYEMRWRCRRRRCERENLNASDWPTTSPNFPFRRHGLWMAGTSSPFRWW